MKKLVYGALVIGSLIHVSSDLGLPGKDQVRRATYQEDTGRRALRGQASNPKTSWVPTKPRPAQA